MLKKTWPMCLSGGASAVLATLACEGGRYELGGIWSNIESGNRMRESLILHPDIAQLLLSGFDSYSNLAAAEKFRFGMLLRNIFSAMQGACIRHLSVEHDPL